MPAPAEIIQLVELFERNYDQYRNSAFTEAAVRHQFIDPFFAALGWDVNNTQGFAEQYKEVVHEDKVKIGGATKAPDYSFRIGKERKFFVEAKKPAVDIQHDIDPAYQLRRYAWSAKLPLSILTDFEELSVYDCRSKPAATDKASAGRILLLNYKEYPARWDEIAGVFAKAAVWQGALDKFAEAKAGKRGTAEVDDEFLAEIERWRDLLAHNLVLRNPTLRGRDINWAVQQIIDRIVFLRICEARDLETFEQLRSLLNGGHTYARLQELFRRADLRYNSGLFHFEVEKDRAEAPDTLTPSLDIDDKALKDIIEHLYYPQSPYEFSVLPADILGHVYERFLGKVIRLTPGRQVKIEEKPEVRKAGGVYYTPTYIVDYIVRQTVGPLLEGKTPAQVGGAGGGRGGVTPPLRILDAACGSGSFLLGAYQFLLDWHLTEYLKDPDRWLKGKRPPLERASGGITRLSIEERKRILMNNIYGVDIDPQAVEVTKLSLLLKVLEGEGVAAQMSFLPERVLPDLGRNIKCGNSLIGPEFYDGKLDLPDEDTTARVNAFDWAREFPEAMAAGGFDAVIGNPPYIRMETFKDLKDYLKKTYTCHDERSDLYAYFIEKEHKLLREGGRFGMIVSNKFLRANYGAPLRDYLANAARIERVVDFAGLPVFLGATVRTIVLITSKTSGEVKPLWYSPPVKGDTFDGLTAHTLTVEEAVKADSYEVPASALGKSGWSFARSEDDALLATLAKRSVRLRTYCDGQILRGVVSGLTAAFVIPEEIHLSLVRQTPAAAGIIKPFLNGRDVRRYRLEDQKQFLIYTYHGINIQQYPSVEKYLRAFRDSLLKRATKQAWYELQQPQLRFAPFMDGPKIVFPDIATAPRFALDDVGYYSSNTTYFIPGRDLYLLGLLNSRLGYFYFRHTCAGLEGKKEVYLRFFGQYLEGFPVRVINFADPADVARHDRMVALVTQMLDLHARLSAEGVPHEKAALQRRIELTDRQIDGLVYELYALTPEEIAVVEGAGRFAS